MPPKSRTTTTKKQYKPLPKIYGYFTPKNASQEDDDTYTFVYDNLKEQLSSTYPSFYKSLLIKNIKKDGEYIGSITLNLQEQGKDLTQEQFNHIVRLFNKQSDILQYAKLFFVSTNEKQGIKYTYTNYVKKHIDSDKIIPHIFLFCETNDIKLNALKEQLKSKLYDGYMDAFAVMNKNKTDYNTDGGYFIKIRLNNEISIETFNEVSKLITEYFTDNYQEDNIKIYYKTGNETNNKKYTATYPSSNKKFIQDE